MKESIETLVIKEIFEKYQVKVLIVIGGDHKKNYSVLKPVLGLKEVLQISHDEKGHKICKYVKKSDIVVTVPFKKDVFKYYIKQALEKHPKPYVHTHGGSSSTNIVESLYDKKERLEPILQKGCGEI